MRSKYPNVESLLIQINAAKKSNLRYELLKLAGFSGYDFVVIGEDGAVLSRTHITVMELVRNDFSSIIQEYKKAEKVYTSKLFKALK